MHNLRLYPTVVFPEKVLEHTETCSPPTHPLYHITSLYCELVTKNHLNLRDKAFEDNLGGVKNWK